MTLGNILKRAGGIAETGRPVKFQVRYKAKDGTTLRREVEGVLLPLSEAERAEALQAADDFCDERKRTAKDLRDAERSIRVLGASLHDPADPRARLVPDAELHQLRAGLVQFQVDELLAQYGLHLLGEYPELFTDADVKKVEEQAEDFSEGAPPSP
jgi:hypothetical protein